MNLRSLWSIWQPGDDFAEIYNVLGKIAASPVFLPPATQAMYTHYPQMSIESISISSNVQVLKTIRSCCRVYLKGNRTLYKFEIVT